MPDPSLKTVSASQVGALFNVSPYDTKWTLWHKFRGTIKDEPGDDRMDWGNKMQPLLLSQCADDLKLEVKPIHEYVRRGVLGATKDAIVYDPQRGPGALETKCVFDYRQWMTRWAGGVPPTDIELQLQTQMFVGDGDEDKPSFGWGIIAVWLAGEMIYFERTPNNDLIEEAQARARDFLTSLEFGKEPDALGSQVEDPLCAKLWPRVERKIVKLDDRELGEKARLYAWSKTQADIHSKTAAQLRPILLKAAGDADTLELPGAFVNIAKSEVEESVVELPRSIKLGLGGKIDPTDSGDFLVGTDVAVAIDAARTWRQVARKASVRTSVDVKIIEAPGGTYDI